jgi:hypothetical protein
MQELFDLGAWARVLLGFAAFVATVAAVSQLVGFTF